MVEIIAPFLGLLGVVIGGFISYKVQSKHQTQIEKIKDRRNKHIAYNQFLLYEGERSPLVVPIHMSEKKEFRWEIYQKQREILYANLHLFDEIIIKNVLHIDYISERAEMMGPEQQDTDEIYHLYSEIKNTIEEDYKKDLKNGK